jgi:hypothetical protein
MFLVRFPLNVNNPFVFARGCLTIKPQDHNLLSHNCHCNHLLGRPFEHQDKPCFTRLGTIGRLCAGYTTDSHPEVDSCGDYSSGFHRRACDRDESAGTRRNSSTWMETRGAGRVGSYAV